jgi:hypothetical protein
MNWDAVGAIAELVGALGVVVSLAYLAVQIRQSTAQSKLNTTAIQASSFQQLLDHHSFFNLRLVDDPGLLEAFMSSDAPNLDPLQRRRLKILMSTMFRSQYNAYSLFESGLISEEQWQLVKAGMSRMRGRSICQEAWSERRQEYPQAFQRAIDEFLGSSPPAAQHGAAADGAAPGRTERGSLGALKPGDSASVGGGPRS